MKVLNIVLSILILILAIASAVFAYLLFDKRQQMVEGYESLGKGIADTARYLDKDSGTQTKLNIDHRSESLDQEIRKLSQLAKQVSEERNALAQALVEISAQAGGNATLESLTELAGYESGAAGVLASVNNLRANRDMLAEGYLQAAGKFDLSLDYNELVGLDRSGWENSIRAFNVDLDNVKKYKEQQEAVMRKVAKSLGVEISLKPARYEADLKNYNAAIAGLQKNKADLEAAKADLTAKLDAANKSIASKEGEIASLNTELATQKDEYNRLSAIIKDEAYEYPVALWRAGSPEARKAVDGKIIDINKKFGYVVIDIGSETLVEQPIAPNREPNKVNPNITAGDEMMVSRYVGADDAKYIGNIKIFKVEGACAFANVTDLADGNAIAVGDTVLFDPEKL